MFGSAAAEPLLFVAADPDVALDDGGNCWAAGAGEVPWADDVAPEEFDVSEPDELCAGVGLVELADVVAFGLADEVLLFDVVDPDVPLDDDDDCWATVDGE